MSKCIYESALCNCLIACVVGVCYTGAEAAMGRAAISSRVEYAIVSPRLWVIEGYRGLRRRGRGRGSCRGGAISSSVE